MLLIARKTLSRTVHGRWSAAGALCLGATLFSVLALCTSAQAGTATSSMAVQIVITASCTINTGTLTFPSTPGTSLVSAAVTANTTVSLSCTTGSSYSVAMDSGSNSLASQRRMKSGTNYINYNLFTDAAYLNAWTTVTNSTTCTTLNSCSLGLGTGLAQTISVFGQVPAVATAPAPGTYTDTVTMTINY